MDFTTIKNFENYVNDIGFKVAEKYPAGFIQDFRDYVIDFVIDEEDDSFEYSFFVETEIPLTFFTDKTGNKPPFVLRLTKI